MNKLFSIVLLIMCSMFSNAQTIFQNLAVRKPVIPNTYSYNYTGVIQKFIVPNKVTSIQVNAIGAKGGTGGGGQVGGAGANITTTLNVTPGQILYIVVGGFSGQSATAKYGFGGDGGIANNIAHYGGAGGGLSGVFTTNIPSNSNALVVAGGGGGGAGLPTSDNYTGGAAANNSSGTSSRGNQFYQIYQINGRHQYGYAATITAAGVGGYAYDNPGGNDGHDGFDINGGDGGTGTAWPGGGGGGAGYYGGGGAAGGWSAGGGGAGGATKTSSGFTSFSTMNTTGDGSVTITCLSNSGLVLHLDAGNPASYSGSGTTWNDLSGNGSNVTLTSTTFNSANGGSIVFNGTSSYANFNANIGTTNVVTVEMWVKTNSLNSPTGAMYFGFNSYNAWTYNGNIGYNTANADQYGFPSSRVNYLGIEGAWKHLVFVMYSSSPTNNKIYVNGESQTMSQMTGTFSTASASLNAGVGKISGWVYPGQALSWLINMNVASFKMYNRELTQQEITNNYNTSSTRFFAERDGLSPATASTSAYQIKQDYSSSTDGFYWIKNANINGGVPFKIYADMTTDGGGWTLLLKNSSFAGWTYANAIATNTTIPFISTAEVTSTSTANYSIVGWADYIKKSASGFQYMIDAGSRRNFGGIWTANGNYSFVKTDNTQTNVTINTQFNTWSYVGSNNGFAQRMPWYSSTAGSGSGYLTISDGTANWWATLVTSNTFYSPSPWISDAGVGGNPNQNPGIIWYWVR
ncbi:MAG: fibrinogen-like YCDxxxxGGGW domain-containing protein [Flavobacterium sp.]